MNDVETAKRFFRNTPASVNTDLAEYALPRYLAKLLSEYPLVADFGCSDGSFMELMRAYAPKTHMIGIDLRVQEAQRKHALVCGDFDALPFRDDSIPAIVSMHSLEYASPHAMAEATRVLKKGGELIWGFHEPYPRKVTREVALRNGLPPELIPVALGFREKDIRERLHLARDAGCSLDSIISIPGDYHIRPIHIISLRKGESEETGHYMTGGDDGELRLVDVDKDEIPLQRIISDAMHSRS